MAARKRLPRTSSAGNLMPVCFTMRPQGTHDSEVLSPDLAINSGRSLTWFVISYARHIHRNERPN